MQEFFYNICMNIYAFYSIVIIGFLVNYALLTYYTKSLRKGDEKTYWWVLLISGIVFGGPVLLISYIIDDVRKEDADFHHHLYLIFGIVYTLIQLTIIILGFVFNWFLEA